MHQANIPVAKQFQVWSEAFKTATLLDGLLPIEINGVMATKYKNWGG